MSDISSVTKDGKILLHDNGDGTYSPQFYLGGQAASITPSTATGVSATLQSAAVANGNGTVLTTTGYGAAVINVTGTFVGTINIEGSEDGSTWVAMFVSESGTTANPQTTITATGMFRCSVAGLVGLRARISAYSSGSITVTALAIPLAAPTPLQGVSAATKFAGEDLTNDVQKVEQRFTYGYISSATTTTIKSGSGFLHTVTVNGGTAGTIQIFDNTAGSGPLIASFDSTNALATYTFDVSFSTGLTVITGAATKVSIAYR